MNNTKINESLLNISYSENNRIIYSFFKRGLDLIASVCGIIILSPLMIIFAILIKLESEGEAIFSQDRVGLNGKKFKMYKFRSMVKNAEEIKEKLKEQNEMSGPMFKMKNDPRITKIGKFIRKTSIDELPQLFNVLKGDMSLVGPRPSLPKEVEEFEDFGYYTDERGYKRWGVIPKPDKELVIRDNRNAYDPRRIDSSDPSHHQMLAQSGVYW